MVLMCLYKMFTDRMVPLLPQEAHAHVINSVPNKEFEVAYRLDCRNLCADFQEDIEFRFSLGITSLMYRFLGAKGTRQAIMGYSDAVSFNKIIDCQAENYGDVKLW